MNVQQVMKELGATCGEVLSAAKALDLKGRVVRGTRVWTAEEVESLRRAVEKARQAT